MKKMRSIVAIVMAVTLLTGVALAYAASPPFERIPPQAYHRSGDWVKMLPRIYPVASESGGGADGGAVSPTPTSIPPPPEPKSYIDTWISSPSYAKPNAYSYWGPRVVVKPATIEGEMNEPGSRRVYKSHTVLYDICLLYTSPSPRD